MTLKLEAFRTLNITDCKRMPNGQSFTCKVQGGSMKAPPGVIIARNGSVGLKGK